MPLPSLMNGAKRCQVLTKRTKQQCKNPAAFGCASCRMHGAHRSRKVLKDIDHPQYKNGEETQLSKLKRSATSLKLHRLEELGWHVQLFHKNATRMVGRKPVGYEKLDLNRPEHLRRAIVQSMNPLKND